MLDLPEPKPSILGADLASELTSLGVYHGTALYHLGPDETIDASKMAEQRWDNPLYRSFGGLYVALSKGRAMRYARSLAESMGVQIEAPSADISPVVYQIGLEPGCEVALDEDYVGWSDYVGYGLIDFLPDFVAVLRPEDQKWLQASLKEWEQETDDLEVRGLYDWVSREYALDVLVAPMETSALTWRILNDRWHIIEAEEVV